MADLSIFSRLVNGINRNVDISTNTLVMSSLKLGTSELTKAKLDLLVLTTDSPTAVDASAQHHHDGIYFTETELGSQADGASGASKVGIDVTPAFTNFTSGNNVQSALEGIDTALGSITGTQVKVSAADTTAGYLGAKVQGDIGTNTTDAFEESILNPGANEILRLRFDQSKVDHGSIAGLGDDDHTQYILAAGTRAFSGNQSMGGFKITSLGTPTADTDAATKGYVDAVKSGLDLKQSVRLITTAALPANTPAGSGVGKTLTANANGALSVDGVAVANGDRILVKDEVAGANNGIYVVTDLGSAGTPFILTRATDFDQDAEVTAGAYTFVAEGSTLSDTGWVLSTNDPITVDTTALAFTQFSAAGVIIAGAGLTKTGNTLDVVSANTGITVNADDIALTLATNSGLEISSGLKVAASIAGSALALTAGVLDVQVDGSTIEVNADALRVKAAGITESHLATSVAGAGLTGGAGSALAVGANVDGSIVVNANDIQVGHAPKVVKSGVAGEAFAANTTFAVRMALTGETAGRWYKADFDASVSNKFYAYGVIEGNGAAAKIAGDAIVVVMLGTITLGSSDVAFAVGEVGEPVHLKAAGAWDAVSQISYTTDQASYRFGVVQETNKILVGNAQLLGIA